jgi:uncharacterized membrane protein YagU involved in acid resistance
VWADAVRGGLAGFAATWLMDLVTTGLYEGQSPETTEHEMAARPHGKGAVENLVDRVEAASGRTFSDAQRSALTQAIHYGLGLGPGVLYAVLRRRMPFLGAGRGLVYGLVLWAVNDEYLNTALGLAGPASGYPLETHWRGLVGHVVLGMATDSAIDITGG